MNRLNNTTNKLIAATIAVDEVQLLVAGANRNHEHSIWRELI
jgi:hypothetical protein